MHLGSICWAWRDVLSGKAGAAGLCLFLPGRGSVQESVDPGLSLPLPLPPRACEKQVDEVDVTGLGLMVWDRVGEQ